MHISPRSLSRGRAATTVGERRQRRRFDAALAGFVGEAHLQQHLQRRRVVRPLRAEPRGDAFAVDGVHPREAFGDLARLVRLQLADEMPARVRQVGQLVDLGRAFLHVVLAEIALARLVGARAPATPAAAC